MSFQIPLRGEDRKSYAIALKTEEIKENTLFGTSLDDEFGYYYEPSKDLAFSD